MAALQAVDAIKHGRHILVEGEPGSGRRLLARSAWCHRSRSARSLFTLDCRMFPSDGVEELLLGERSSADAHATIHLGKLKMSIGGGLLLLHVESLHLKTQRRLAQALSHILSCPRSEAIQLMMTCTCFSHTTTSLHPDLAALLLRIRVPALRERVEDIRALAESFLHNASPFERIRCSLALIDRFCDYDWPGNVTELRTVLRRLLLEQHNGLLDVHHLADLPYRDDTCFALRQDGHGLPRMDAGLIQSGSSVTSRSLQ
jgi:DNA-binding NtrC family response regulator